MSARVSTASAFAPIAARNWDSQQFKAIFALVFPVYLVAAIGARLQPRHWQGTTSQVSIFAEAVKAAGTTARMAFAG